MTRMYEQKSFMSPRFKSDHKLLGTLSGIFQEVFIPEHGINVYARCLATNGQFYNVKIGTRIGEEVYVEDLRLKVGQRIVFEVIEKVLRGANSSRRGEPMRMNKFVRIEGL